MRGKSNVIKSLGCALSTEKYSNCYCGTASSYSSWNCFLHEYVFVIFQPKFQEDGQLADNKNALVFITFLQSRRKSPKWYAVTLLIFL
jgi:hypothetical protein